MHPEIYRYTFQPHIEFAEVEASLLLSIWSVEALHGEAQVRLDCGHAIDKDERKLVIDASTEVGMDLNRILTGFLQREFEPTDFSIERVTETPEPVSV
ncbi:hypothetical protein [uncultured Rubinisphaera sp.]|uniref:hypothetical protein n=1 Tax=uncultured Rubinisphaera sp. TaxID=1678686 RepID=UPI0030DB5537